MEATCHRCNETLRITDRYCGACGLPHLTYVAPDAPVVDSGDEAGPIRSIGTTQAVLLGGIAWRPALRAAAVLAVPASVLCSGLTELGQNLGLVWMTGAAAWAVALYVKRARPTWLSAGAGARIGLLTGVFASWLTLAVNGFALWFARFVLHQGGQMDALWQENVERSLEMSQQMMVQMGMAGVQVAQAQQLNRAMMLSGEGRAGIALMGFLAGAAFLLVFAAAGGAIGAKLMAQRSRPSA